ncbi:unnamed protein product [Angiostrongylus costaricensis]|uniref:Cystatin domain-containing protein n=1 Tax=Angiostrongylus costaricensis TaxID=334426 RepID=A0A0R3Q0N1_ANGCS|nr:unnamed protein product [Angiostrongylus costaricensis]
MNLRKTTETFVYVFQERAWKAAKGINDDASNAGPYHMMPIKVSNHQLESLDSVLFVMLVSVLKATSQVVAGVKYTFEVLYGESTCKKGDFLAADLNATNCQLKSGGRRALYEVELWEKPWENFEQFNVKKLRNVAADEEL